MTKINAETPDPPIRHTEQAIVYYPGDGMPLVINDTMEVGVDNPLLYLNDKQMDLFVHRVSWLTRMIHDATTQRQNERIDKANADRIEKYGAGANHPVGVENF